jgi:membrane protein required for beta-lactamase induction
MGEFINSRTRLLGAIFLLIALVMLVVGETLLKGRLGNLGFVLYWLICAAFTLSAGSVALVDMAAVRKRLRQEQRKLIEDTLRDMPDEKNESRRGKSEPSRGRIND